MKRLLSLFDYSGTWSAPFYNGGWDVIQWDIKLADYMDVNNIDCAETALELFEFIDGLLIAVPCTEFTVSCSQYWNMKDQDGRTAAALQLVKQSQKLVDLFRPTDPDYDGTFFWSLENPVGRLPKLAPELGQPQYFNPCDFAGYLNPNKQVLNKLDIIRMKNGHGVTDQENDLVVKWNAYTKRTGLWGEFNMPLKKRIEPVKTAPQGSFTQRLGGKSEKTKELRSITPLGFAQAFYEANDQYRCYLDINDNFIYN